MSPPVALPSRTARRLKAALRGLEAPPVVGAVIGAVVLFAGAAVAAVSPTGATALVWLLCAAAVLSLMAAAWMVGAGIGEIRAGELLEAAAEVDSQAVLVTDKAGTVLYANSAFQRLFGGGGEVRAGLGMLEASLLDARSEEMLERLKGSAAIGIGDYAEIAIRPLSSESLSAADGAEWRALSVTPIPGRGGHALWRASDITARRELDAARRREERLLADLLDNLPVGMYSADGSGVFLYVNRTLADWLGIAPGENRAEASALADFAVGETETGDGDDEDMPSRLAPGEMLLKGRSGEPFRAVVRHAEREGADGKVLYSRSVVLRDVAAGTLSGSALVEWEHRFRSLFADAPVAIVLVDLQGEVTDCNKAFLKLVGMHRDGVVGRALTDRISKEDRSDVNAQLSKLVMGTIPAAHLEVRLPGVREQEVVASLYASCMEVESDEPVGLIIHFIDTTERKSLELQFTQAQKMQAVGQLAGGVAHDFNNLLTAMIGFCDLLLGRHGPGDPSFADIMQIKQNANRAANLVRQLLAFSRRQTLQPKLVDVREALSELSNLLRRLIGETIDLTMDLGRDPRRIRVDPGQFDQVVINLAVNARDAMPGGGTLVIAIDSVDIEQPRQRGPDVMPPGRYVRIDVADSGIGIPKEDLERIFEPFFSTKEVGAGTGLGLSTVYGIIRQTDGFIFVDSAPGEGSTFSIFLPEYAAESDEEERGRQEAPAADGDLTGRGTVLLVEDEDAVRLFAARALRNKGYQVLEADNGERALDVLNSADGHIDLIVTDVVMPGMDGHTLVRFVREERPDVKVILISGYAEDILPEEIGNDPTIHFLHKPFSLKELAGKVKSVIEG